MSKKFLKDIHGRGSSQNISNRFEPLQHQVEVTDESIFSDEEDFSEASLKTEVIKDFSRTIITENKSPDIGFRYSVNAYRGCEHGCAYCYARPTHEYLGFSAGLDFESKILIKEEAPQLLREALLRPSWEGEPVVMSGVTDCYQPLERKYELTRRCLKVFAEFKNPTGIITKNALVTRDIDILCDLASFDGVFVLISVTSLDTKLARDLEPRTSQPLARLKAIEQLAKAGIHVGVNVAPCIPGLTDHEMPMILKAAADAGAKWAGYTPLRLPFAVSPLFEEWLTLNRPLRKEKILNAIRDIRGGKLNDAQFGSRMRGEGPRAEQMNQMFHIYSKKYGLNEYDFHLSSSQFQRPGDQLKFSLD